MLKKIVSCAIITSFVFSSAITANACTSFYMGKSTTETGSYIWGRSEDIGASYRKLFKVNPAETHEPGDMYISSTGFKWPYPAQTLRYSVTPDSYNNERITPEPYGEVGMNEMGVSISSTVTLSNAKSAITSIDPMVSSKNGGLAEIETASVVLMQATSARHGCEILAEIIDTVGAAGREGTMISDPSEVWFFQILSGHQYIAVKCPDDKIGFSPNVTGNVDVSNSKNVIMSPGLISTAEAAGTLVLDDDENIKVADSYANSAAATTGRMRLGVYYLQDGEESVSARPTKYHDYFWETRTNGGKYSLYEALRLLAYRGENSPWYAGSGTGNGTAIGNDGTVEAHVYDVRPDMPEEIATVMWHCMTPAEFGIYIPYYGNLITDTFEMYKGPDVNSYNNADPDANSYYNVFRELYTQCKTGDSGTIESRARFGGGVKAFWERYQKSLIEQQAGVDAYMLNVCEDRELAEKKATEISVAVAEEAYEYAKQMLKELKEFRAAGTEGNFIPSALLDEKALPHYAFVDGIKIANASATLGVGKTMTLTAVVSPDNAANKDVIWTSSNDKVATVEDGVVKAVSAGSVTIEARTVDGGFTRKTAIRIM